jgi:hypothetical protein
MKLRNIITAAALAAMPFAAQAATLVVPAAGTGPGANGSQWQSELTLHTAAPRPVTLSLSFHQGATVLGPVSITLEARETLSIQDIVRTEFGVTSGSGALVIEAADRDARTLAVTSRTVNTSSEGELGQDIPAIDVADASGAGDVTALTGPSAGAASRFNFGLYAVDATSVKWELIRADGTVAATKDVTYLAGQHTQHNAGVQSVFGAAPADNDTVHARVLSGRAIFYGSVVNETGDPSFVPGIRTREDIVIHFTGLDLDENGTVDVTDADGDGVLDTRIDIVTSMFGGGEFFRIVAEGEFGEEVEYEIVSTPSVEAALLDGAGRLRVLANGDVKGTNGELRIRAISGDSSTVLVIPVRYR